jgi:hypothetical protein
VKVEPIPSVSLIRAMALRAPGFSSRDLLPSVLAGCVVEVRIGPGHVIPEVELPWPIERNGAETQSVRDKSRLGRGSFCLRVRRRSAGDQEPN